MAYQGVLAETGPHSDLRFDFRHRSAPGWLELSDGGGLVGFAD